MHKDMRLLSASGGCADLPILDTVREALKTAEARGMGNEDYSAVVKLLESKRRHSWSSRPAVPSVVRFDDGQ